MNFRRPDDPSSRLELSFVGTNLGNLPIPQPLDGTGRSGGKTGGKPPFKDNKKQVMATEAAPLKVPKPKAKSTVGDKSSARPTKQEEQQRPSYEEKQPRPSLEERQNKKYPFLDEDVSDIFEYLLQPR